MADSSSNATDVVDAGATTDGADTEAPSGREARYRVRLRETEAERDALTQRVEGLQKQIITGLCEAEGVKPDAVFAALGDDGIAGLLDDDGAVDADKVGAAVGVARERFGIVDGPRRPLPDRTQGQNHDGVGDGGPDAAWLAMLGADQHG
ncbi:hypothetical protein [Gordonia sp. NPDC003376]